MAGQYIYVGVSATGNCFDAQIEGTLGPGGYFESGGVYRLRGRAQSISLIQGEDKPSPLLWTIGLGGGFVGIVGAMWLVLALLLCYTFHHLLKPPLPKSHHAIHQ